MSRCQHCNKLTHSEDLNVFFDISDYGKVEEISRIKDYLEIWKYIPVRPDECGKLKVGDIWIHFIVLQK